MGRWDEYTAADLQCTAFVVTDFEGVLSLVYCKSTAVLSKATYSMERHSGGDSARRESSGTWDDKCMVDTDIVSFDHKI